MKKIGLLLAAIGLGCCVGLGTMQKSPFMVRAEDEIVEPSEKETKATVVLPKLQHGSIEATVLEGEEGDICKLDVKAEILYLVKSVSVNGTALVEDENIRGLYAFALVKGENVVAVEIVVNQELLGELSNIYEQARNKDWANLFTIDNLITIIKWVFDCGILIAIIRYYVRDKRLSSKLEKSVKVELDKIIPQTTKNTVIAVVKETLAPIFAQIKADNADIRKGMVAFSKAMALAQENTPESKVAILDLLSTLNFSDDKTLADVKAYIDKLFADHASAYNEVMNSLNKISESNKAIADIKEEKAVEKAEDQNLVDVGDGTSI